MAHLHTTLKLVHLDLKPSSVMWNSISCRAALADFGIASEIQPKTYTVSTACTVYYRPPELFGNWNKVDNRHLVPAVDAWSYGCFLYTVSTGSLLFASEHKSTMAAHQKIAHFCKSVAVKNDDAKWWRAYINRYAVP